MNSNSRKFDFDLIQKILDLNIGYSQADNAKMFQLIGEEFPVTVKKYKSGSEYNGWVAPHDWNVKEAYIKKGDKIIFDGTIHPLALAQLSSPYSGCISKEELDQHVFYSEKLPNAFVYHNIFTLRPWCQGWGFCVPYNIYKEWPPGKYQIHIDAEFRKGQMEVAECRHEGVSKETIVFNAHTCHTCQANDDLVSVFVILELFKWLSTRKTHYSYLGVFAPEHLGTAFYLGEMSDNEIKRLKLGCFLEAVGSETPLVLQQSFTGLSIIDRVAEQELKKIEPNLRVGEFRTIVGNDETVWEAPGIEIPMISISRVPYPEYHTNYDNLDIISEEKLEETLTAVKNIVTVLEEDRIVNRKFNGLIALSNPKYDLYVERPQIVLDKGKRQEPWMEKLGKLQDHLPRYINGTYSIFAIAEKFELPFSFLSSHLKRFEDKNLVSLDRLPSLDFYCK